MRFTPWAVVSIVLLALGVVFYLGMGVTYGNWADVGVYSVASTLIGFGLFGFLAAQGNPAGPGRRPRD